jgi:membrane protein YdbS with pleckstrin-like domain
VSLTPPSERKRYYADDLTRWVFVAFGLVQAVVTMLMAFDVIEGTQLAQAVTAVALVAYVAVNELLVKPHRPGKEYPNTPPSSAWESSVPEG